MVTLNTSLTDFDVRLRRIVALGYLNDPWIDFPRVLNFSSSGCGCLGLLVVGLTIRSLFSVKGPSVRSCSPLVAFLTRGLAEHGSNGQPWKNMGRNLFVNQVHARAFFG